MILDLNLVLDSNRALTVTATSNGVYDTAGVGVGVPAPNIFGTDTIFGNDIGGGGPNASAPQLVVIVGTAFAAGGAGTLQVQLQAAPDTGANTGTPGTYQTIAQTDAFGLATLTAAQVLARFTVPSRYPGSDFPRFYRLNYVIGTGPMTAGTISFAGLATGIDDAPMYSANY